MGFHAQFDTKAYGPLARFDDGAVERDLQVASKDTGCEGLSRKQVKVPRSAQGLPVVLEDVTGQRVQIGRFQIQDASRRQMIRNPSDQPSGIGHVFDGMLADDGIEPFLALYFLDRSFDKRHAAVGKIRPGFGFELEVIGEELEWKRRKFRQVGQVPTESRADVQHLGSGL